MKYIILQVHAIFNDTGHLETVYVLWRDGKYKRASYCTNKKISGYYYLTTINELNEFTLQKICGYGMKLNNDDIMNIFSLTP